MAQNLGRKSGRDRSPAPGGTFIEKVTEVVHTVKAALFRKHKLGTFIEKVTEVVHRVVPEHLVPVFFAGALVAMVVLFLLVIIGFSRDPGEVAKKDDSAAPHRTTPPPPVRPVASPGGGRWGGGGWGGGSYRGRTPNDDRSDSMNPNNAAFNASQDNRANQLNPNNPAYHSSRGRK